MAKICLRGISHKSRIDFALMSERKKLKSTNVSKAKKLYESLKMQSSLSSASLQEYVEYFMGILSVPQARSCGIMALSELVRISGFTNILTPIGVIALFEALHEALVLEDIALGTFIDSRIPSCLKDRELILRFFDLAKKTSARNMEYLRQILAIFIEESDDRKEYVDLVAKNPDIYGSLVGDIHKYIDIDTLTEEEYSRLFCNNECIRANKEFRAVKGRKRLHFVQKAIDSHYQDVMENYIKDKDKRVRVVLAQKVDMMDERFFRILLNDHQEDVRLAVVKRIKWSSSLPDISERLLDMSYDVRREMVRIYRDGLFRLRQLPIFKKDLVKVGKLNFDESGHHEFSRDYEMFVKFVVRLFEGCLTVFKNEYVQIIKESNFALEFLAEHQNCPGARVLFSTMEVTSYAEVPRNLREFCLRHLYRGSLSDKEIMAAIEDNVFAVLRFIKDPSMFYSTLLEKAMAVRDLESAELIVESIRDLLSENEMIRGKKDIKHMIGASDPNSMDPAGDCSTSTSLELDSPNLYLINAHTKCDSMFVEQQYGKGAYHHLYFIVHQLRGDPRIPLCIKNCTHPIEQKIQLLLYLDNPEILSDFSDLLIKHNLEPKLQNVLLSKKTLTASLIYFLCTGLVCVKSSSFFIRCIRAAINCSSPEKVKWIFDRYIRAVDQKTFDVFYSICKVLKEHSISKSRGEFSIPMNSLSHNGSIILNPKISDHDYPGRASVSQGGMSPGSSISGATAALPVDSPTTEPAQDINGPISIAQSEQSSVNCTENFKFKLTKSDKMLHFICNLVMSSRKGTFIELKTNLTRYGFSKMSEGHIEMVEHGQVMYE